MRGRGRTGPRRIEARPASGRGGLGGRRAPARPAARMRPAPPAGVFAPRRSLWRAPSAGVALKEGPQAPRALGPEGAGLGDACDAVDAEHAEVLPELAPGNERPDLAPEPETERLHRPLRGMAARVAVGEAEPLAVRRRPVEPVDHRAVRLGKRAGVVGVDGHRG